MLFIDGIPGEYPNDPSGQCNSDSSSPTPQFNLDQLSLDCRKEQPTPIDPNLPQSSKIKPNGKTRVSFIVPNEEKPQNAGWILSKSTAGTYVSVGTERGFIGAAMSKATALLLIDRDLEVISFNRINIALLQAAKSIKHYRTLRRRSPFLEWKKAANNPGVSPSSKALLENRETWRWWRNKVRHEKRFRNFHAPINQLLPKGAFKGANYLFIDKYFRKLQTMARSNRIACEPAELTNKQEIRRIAKKLEQQPNRLSVLDLSNAWQYIRPIDFVTLLKNTRGASGQDGILLVTKRSGGQWDYFGFTFGFIFSIPSKINLPSRLLKVAIRSNKSGVTSGEIVLVPNSIDGAIEPKPSLFQKLAKLLGLREVIPAPS
ncbi:MAG: hypothetical protein KDD53_06110 [Bdellovibrionales bacterium]|nr:hypothetical protein [Bdellovibrionales bacterium]